MWREGKKKDLEGEEGWPEDHFSICTFHLKPEGHKTQLTFTQHGIPEHKVEELKNGWKQFYWNPMKEYLKTGMRKVVPQIEEMHT